MKQHLSQATSDTSRERKLLPWLLLTLVLLAFSLWNLTGRSMWWDEGWTLSVARHWVELDHYGRLRDGELARGGLEASFTVTVPVGVSMKLFGVGLWQGRLFGVFCAVGVILLLAALTDRLFDRQVAWATVFAALLLTMHPEVHPLLQGRQVLAEMPMLLYLLAGYLALWWALRGQWVSLLPAMLGLGLAWISKAQTGPFLIVSLVIPLLAALLWRQWNVVTVIGLALVGSYAVAQGLVRLVPPLLIDPQLPTDHVEGLESVVALVSTPLNRWYALSNLGLFALPTLLGVGWGLHRLWYEQKQHPRQNAYYLQLALLSFVGSWLGWYSLLSAGLPRYMGVPVVIGSIFVAVLLQSLTSRFHLAQSMRKLADLVTLRHPTWAGAAALLALILTITGLYFSLRSLIRYYPIVDFSAQRVATLLNAHPPGTRIETYESELHVLLDQPYTFPPDQIHVALLERSILGANVEIDYDPLTNDPDYLVIGLFARSNELYQPVIDNGSFRLIKKDGAYEIFERIRP
ncbi:glycosyltransferase family 39 protein [Candidatus Chloroploca sp. M-50]|uniref:Glycosyltransferase family 39 protein n=1 Tax=Candidatus Chloroploca mongolica TaxID=2528176 RepID=A0ABS4DCY3_9CHLR|nr:glycosyltransferase family 39 protein [Candidatus Chloroploca mongolica]MBP1467303.1 glycosyltransferase family 39 protein [Candidatus Chloroploca mongolica]